MTELPLFDNTEKLNTGVRSHFREGTQVVATEHAGIVRRSALWSAYGDALGWISELTDERGLKRRTGGAPLERPISWNRRIGGRSGVTVTLPQGCYSDDSQLRLATGRAIRPDGFDVEMFAKVELPVWLSYALGGGKSTSAAATNLANRKVPWFSNTFKGWTSSGGNGAAMRIQPHVWAARDPDDPTTFLPDVIRNSICTHSHPIGLLGASLHALTLAHTIVNRRYPSPDDLMTATGVAAELPEIIRSDIEVGHYWRSLFEVESGGFPEAWARAIKECRQAIQVAGDASGNSGSERYTSIVDRLGLRDPARRGAGALTAVAAIGLIWCEERPEQALNVAANAIGTDTDTIATMAGAVLGVLAEEEPPVEVLDADLFRSEASRLAEIACGGKPSGHPYPDLLHWSAPKARADYLVELDDSGLYVRGFGHAEAQSEPIPASQISFCWQWIKLETGQTLFVKRRRKLEKIEKEDKGLRVRQSLHQASPTSIYSNNGDTRASTEEGVPLRDEIPSHSHSKDQSGLLEPEAGLKAMIDHLEKHQYDDKVVGPALRRVINKCTDGEIAAFLAVLIERLRESPSAHSE